MLTFNWGLDGRVDTIARYPTSFYFQMHNTSKNAIVTVFNLEKNLY